MDVDMLYPPSYKVHGTATRRRPSKSPINRLPDELLVVIFGLLVTNWEIHAKANDPSWRELGRMLSDLLNVSMRWRNVATNSPRLWRNVWHGPPWHSGMAHYEYFVCIRRSGATPLHLWAGDRASLYEVIDHLQPLNGVARITSLDLEEHRTWQPPWTKVEPTRDIVLPNLSSLTLRLSEHVTATDIMRLLEQCCHVEHLHIVETWASEGVGSLNRSVDFPRLRTMIVEQGNRPATEEVFRVVRAPRLQRLSVRLSETLPRSLHQGGLALQPSDGQSMSEVRWLSIRGTLTPADLLSILWSIPTVEHLLLDCHDLIITLATDEGINACVNLNTLQVNGLSVSLPALEILIDARRQSPIAHPLETVCVDERVWQVQPPRELQRLSGKARWQLLPKTA